MHIELPEKKYYKIGEVASAFGVNTSLIRFWEKEFSIIKAQKKCQRKSSFYSRRHSKLQINFQSW